MENNHELEALQTLSALQLEETIHRYGLTVDTDALGQAVCIEMLQTHAKWQNRLNELKQLCQSIQHISSEYLELHQAIRTVLSEELKYHPLSPQQPVPFLHNPSKVQLLNAFVQRFDNLQISPESADLLNNLGKLAYTIGDFDKAAWAFEEAAKLPSKPHKKAEHYYNAYCVALQTKQWNYALNAFKQAIALDQQQFESFPCVQYQVIEILGCNEYGTLFLCKDHYQQATTNNEMADKVVIKSLNHPELLRPCQHFFPEVRSLKHPNIVHITHCDFVERHKKLKPYLVMDYFVGISLDEYIQTQGTLNAAETHQLAILIAEALHTAHQQNIFHRHLNASNVIIKQGKSSWQVKLMDFALALPPLTEQDTTLANSASLDIYQFAELISFALFKVNKPSWKHWQKLEKDNEHHLARLLDECLDENTDNRPKDFALISDRLKQVPTPQKTNYKPLKISCFWGVLVIVFVFFALFRYCLQQETQQELQITQSLASKETLNSSSKSPLLQNFVFFDDNTRKAQSFRDTLQSGGQAPVMLKIPISEDEFIEKHTKQVVIDKAFAISQYEITKGEFAQFVQQTNYMTDAEKNDSCIAWTSKEKKNKWYTNPEINWQHLNFSQTEQHPVVCVSLNDAKAYAVWLSKETQQEYRLPIETEWVYAASGNTETLYSWGEETPLCEKQAVNGAKFYDEEQCLYTGTEAVGSYQANPFGLFDVHGNVWEWVDIGNTTKEYLVIRGGSWSNNAEKLATAFRTQIKQQECCYDTVGFRVVRVLP